LTVLVTVTEDVFGALVEVVTASVPKTTRRHTMTATNT
jgi:hypothetical protein